MLMLMTIHLHLGTLLSFFFLSLGESVNPLALTAFYNFSCSHQGQLDKGYFSEQKIKGVDCECRFHLRNLMQDLPLPPCHF